MAKYTIQVKTIVESLSGRTESVGLSTLDEAIEIARTKIFDFDYPFYDPTQKANFETWILESILMDEINYETYGLWHLKLRVWMKTNMDYYSKMFKSLDSIIDPFVNYNLKRVTQGNEKGSNNGSNESTSSSIGWNMFSDTPQGGIEGLENGDYLTNATKDLNDETSNSKNASTYTNDTNGVETISGFSGITYSRMLKEYRESFANIKQIFIDDFKSKLTLKLWY
mgnify:FL=1|jgi:hypothetical protein|nr:MAG TPA: Lower collar protein [Caudoviricetes sp.]